MIHTTNDKTVTEYLAGPVVDARLELTSVLGGETLAVLAPSAGSVSWDGTDRRGSLDVDVVAPPVMGARHPLANLGQVLRAWWHWPEIGVRVPCGYWLISEPAARTEQVWQVSADPEGPARLARAQWWLPGGRIITGKMVAQVRQMMLEARVPWTQPAQDHSAPDTECETGDSILSSAQKVLDHAGLELRPDRFGAGVIVDYRRVTVTHPDWSWSDTSPRIHRVAGANATEEIPNRVTVWWERDADGVREVGGWSEPLMQGPRRWGGPYGQVPFEVKLDAPASQTNCRDQARRTLAAKQERSATVSVVMRADPRVEVGDTARVTSPSDATDCFARVTSVKLDAGTGLATIECAAIAGTVAGVPATYTNEGA